jgi:hypothetical protein
MRILILPVLLAASASASIPVRDACSEDASVVANVQETDAVQIRHAVSGESVPCYAVSVRQASGEVRGFLISSTLPVVQEFERRRALESRVPVGEGTALAAEEKKKIAAPMTPVGPPFGTWSGQALNGRRVQIAPGNAPATLVTFWSAESGPARRYVKRLMATESEFGARGLKSYGLVETGNTGRAGYFLEDLGLVAPQAVDRQGLAAKYKADPVQGTTLVLNASNEVVTISSNPVEIRAAVARLLSLK